MSQIKQQTMSSGIGEPLPMHIQCLGINYKTAGIALRERLAFSDEAVKAGLARLGCGVLEQDESPNEMVILSTCNRIEVYAVSTCPDFYCLEQFLSEARSVPLAEFQSHLYQLVDEEAVDHLLNVAAGLDSLVLGEPQILGQVTHALELARGQNTAGPMLSRLFQVAIHAGKRVHTETGISRNPASISSVAVKLAVEIVPHLETAQVVVLGAGEMAELVVESMRKRGVSRIQVVNRTIERARDLARLWGGEASTFERLDHSLEIADILIASTGAPHTLIHQPAVQQAMAARPDRPLLIIDIAMPRNVDEEVGEVPGVRVVDLDDLKEYLNQSIATRQGEMPEAHAILDQEKAAFMDYLGMVDLLPLIKNIYEKAEAIRQAELEKTLRRMPGLSPEERKRIEAMTGALVKKLLHDPVTRLRAEAQCPNVVQYALVTRSLFGLAEPASSGSHCYYSTQFSPLDHLGDESELSPCACE